MQGDLTTACMTYLRRTSETEMEIAAKDITPRCKRVSFQDRTELSFLTPDMAEASNLEISELFPNMSMPKPILRRQGSRQSFSPRSDNSRRSKDKKKVKKKLVNEDKEPRKRNRKPLLPSKEPTESLAQVLLRAMTHREYVPDNRKSKFVLPRLALVSNPDARAKDDDRGSVHSQKSNSSRGRFMTIPSRNCGSSLSVDQKTILPEIIATPRDSHVVTFDRICGLCQRSSSYPHLNRKPAAGFCKYCDEYLCASCVINHRGKLTKIHPVVVFYCTTCREMNILVRQGSAYCIQCKHFYCSVCVVAHCSRRDHDVLEGKDLLDVIDAMIGK